jgi:hypothetical protein
MLAPGLSTWISMVAAWETVWRPAANVRMRKNDVFILSHEYADATGGREVEESLCLNKKAARDFAFRATVVI